MDMIEDVKRIDSVVDNNKEKVNNNDSDNVDVLSIHDYSEHKEQMVVEIEEEINKVKVKINELEKMIVEIKKQLTYLSGLISVTDNGKEKSRLIAQYNNIMNTVNKVYENLHKYMELVFKYRQEKDEVVYKYDKIKADIVRASSDQEKDMRDMLDVIRSLSIILDEYGNEKRAIFDEVEKIKNSSEYKI